jgi:micrococcal nuclease
MTERPPRPNELGRTSGPASALRPGRRIVARLAVAMLAVGLAGCSAGPAARSLEAASLPPSSPASPPTPVPSPTPPSPTTTPAPTATPAPLGAAPLGPTERATVLRVVDGDTIEVDRGRGPEKVRYIGIDTPETVDPSRPVAWMGREASAANAALVEGRTVVLERDVSETDRYGRLLRYVWIEDPAGPGGWIFVNLALVAAGFAQVATYPPDVRYAELFLAAQAEARAAERGLWGPRPTPTPILAPPPKPTATARATGDCDPAYPRVCIPPPPPDLDCGDIPYRRFEVLPPDPHRFDGDHDGIGCESG